MQRHNSGPMVNNLHSHASLLLSANKPTIINSLLQATSSDNTSSSRPNVALLGPANQQATCSTLSATPAPPPAPATAAPTTTTTNQSPLDDYDCDLPSDSINFKKPQNEIFKKLDGKIQKIVAAHSNLNKLYALNDFSGTIGPKKPFELPPQLPRPPPWVPKVRPTATQQAQSQQVNCSVGGNEGLGAQDVNTSANKLGKSAGLLKIDRRHVQRPSSSTSSSNVNGEESLLSSSPSSSSPDHQKREQRRKFQMQLIDMFCQEIAAVTKLAKLKFNSQTLNRIAPTVEQKSLLLKKSPQSLFDTIRRETSLLLGKRESQTTVRTGRTSACGSSLLADNQNRPLHQQQRPYGNLSQQPQQHSSQSVLVQQRQRPLIRYHSVKVVVPPTECIRQQKQLATNNTGNDKSSSSQAYDGSPLKSKTSMLDLDVVYPPRTFTVKYRTLQLKLRQLNGRFKSRRRLASENSQDASSCSPDLMDKKKPTPKSLDRIVDRLKARCLSTVDSPSPAEEAKRPNSQQDIRATAAPDAVEDDIQSEKSQVSRAPSTPPSSPRPIPIFRMSPTRGLEHSFNNGTSGGGASRSAKSKKAKKILHFGLKLGNYFDKECPQQGEDKLTIEQFAKCLDLVRSNDIALQLHQEKLMQSEVRWRVPVGDRSLRLRRIRGGRIHMPASASYRASRKAGLQ